MIYRVLVVDVDPRMAGDVAAELSALPLEIDAASDGTIAMAKVLARPPDLVISGVSMPGMDGWELLRKLRARPELDGVPVLLVGRSPTRADVVRCFRLGADDFIALPFVGPELLDRVRAALVGRDRRPARTPAERPMLRSSLHDFGLGSLMVFLEMERKTGILVVTRSASDELCSIAIRDGRVVAAACEPGCNLVHAPAVYRALSWADGTLQFRGVPVDIPDQLGMSTSHLLMEGARRLDEARTSRFTRVARDVVRGVGERDAVHT